ncbi:hypothetical protein A4G99_19565 [Haladaptatus sp. R4]|nr:hypothetical protein A4G99_19565 [Haladaptatus sp. R4]
MLSLTQNQVTKGGDEKYLDDLIDETETPDVGHSIADPEENLNSCIENPYTIEIQSIDADEEQANSTKESESSECHNQFTVIEKEIEMHSCGKEC